MDQIHENWEDTPEVAMALELSDPNQPYSCSSSSCGSKVGCSKVTQVSPEKQCGLNCQKPCCNK